MKITDLKANPQNPRTITDDKLKQLKKAILKFGDLSGIVYNRKSKQLVCGHQRVASCEESSDITFTKKFSKPTKTGTVAEGFTFINGERFNYREVYWDATTEKAANIAANKNAGEWNMPLLGEWMKELGSFDLDFDMDLTMFDEEEIQALGQSIIVSEHTRTGKTGVDEDEIPEKAPARTQPGDVYVLGDHRLLCGDSTNPIHIKKLMNGKLADMVWTDPPYNVALGMESPAAAKARNRRTDGLTVMNDKMSDEDFRGFLFKVYTAMFQNTQPGGAIYVAHADSEGYNFRGAAKDSGWLIKQCLIWKKSSLVMGRQDYHWIHEPILYGWKEGGPHNWYTDRKQTTVLEFAKPGRNAVHPTMKPVELVEYCLGNSSKITQIVLDTFGGSGTTMIAAEKLHRKCYMMELDPHYCDVIVERWEKYSGKKVKLVARAKTQMRRPANQGKVQANGKSKSEATA